MFGLTREAAIPQSLLVEAALGPVDRLPYFCSMRVATAATSTKNTSTIVNAVQEKCGVVNSPRKFFDDCTGSPVRARS